MGSFKFQRSAAVPHLSPRSSARSLFWSRTSLYSTTMCACDLRASGKFEFRSDYSVTKSGFLAVYSGASGGGGGGGGAIANYGTPT